MISTRERLLGRWRISETGTWDNDYLDLVEPAFIAVEPNRAGEFRFGAVVASLDCAYSQTDADFRFHGSDEGDEVSGEGWAECEGADAIHGEIAFWNGKETTFKARRWPKS